MNTLVNLLIKSLLILLLTFLLFAAKTNTALAALLVDDFSHAQHNSLDLPRQFLDDKVAGGKTTAFNEVIDGAIRLYGQITPPRGQPGWASAVLPLAPMGKVKDVSNFDGVRLVIKLNAGNLSISANSALVTNFDFHAAQLTVPADGKFHEVRVPFASMKQMWSAPVSLDTSTLNSLSIVAFGLQSVAYDYAIDEVSFY